MDAKILIILAALPVLTAQHVEKLPENCFQLNTTVFCHGKPNKDIFARNHNDQSIQTLYLIEPDCSKGLEAIGFLIRAQESLFYFLQKKLQGSNRSSICR